MEPTHYQNLFDQAKEIVSQRILELENELTVAHQKVTDAHKQLKIMREWYLNQTRRWRESNNAILLYLHGHCELLERAPTPNEIQELIKLLKSAK